MPDNLLKIDAHNRLVRNDRLPTDQYPTTNLVAVSTPNYSKGVTLDPRVIVIHYTAEFLSNSVIPLFTNPTAKVSAHFLISAEREQIHQFEDCSKVMWHAGRSAYNARANVNSFGIGIELENPGPLKPLDIEKGRYATWYNSVLSTRPNGQPKDIAVFADQIAQLNIQGRREYYLKYSDWQIDVLIALCKALIERYPTIEDIVGHSDVSPGRKIDPGPHFPMDYVRKMVFGRTRDGDASIDVAGSVAKPQVKAINPSEGWPTLYATTDNVWLRGGPGMKEDKIMVLPKNAIFRLFTTHDDPWYFGTAEDFHTSGYVYKTYLQPLTV